MGWVFCGQFEMLLWWWFSLFEVGRSLNWRLDFGNVLVAFIIWSLISDLVCMWGVFEGKSRRAIINWLVCKRIHTRKIEIRFTLFDSWKPCKWRLKADFALGVPLRRVQESNVRCNCCLLICKWGWKELHGASTMLSHDCYKENLDLLCREYCPIHRMKTSNSDVYCRNEFQGAWIDKAKTRKW